MATRGKRLGIDPAIGKGDPDASAIGNRVGEHDPRGIYGENQSQPTNILGERAQSTNMSVTAGGAGQYPANQLPARTAFELPEDRRYVERGPFGALAPGQTADRNLIVGENTMGHHIGAALPAGQGAMDQAAERALGLGLYGIPPMHSPDKVRRQRFDQMLIAYEQFAKNIQANLREMYDVDPARFDRDFSHLRKVNLPLPVPDPTLQPGFSTFEAEMFKTRGVSIQCDVPNAQAIPPQFHPDHPDYVPPTDEQKLLPYQEGGYAGMSAEMAHAYRVPLAEVRKADLAQEAKRAASSRPRPARPTAPPPSAPQPWKDKP